VSVTIRHVRVAAITSGGPTQDLTISSGPGTTPVAALFFMNRCITNSVEAAHNQLCVGATDGTRSRCIMMSCEDALGTTNCSTKAINDACLITVNPNTGVLDGYAVFSSFGTDKVTISWTDLPPAAYFIDVILWFGDNMSVYVDDFTVSDTSKNIGFEPDQIIGFGSSVGSFTDIASTSLVNDASLSIGFLNNQGGIVTQRSFGFYDQDAINLALTPGTPNVSTYTYLDSLNFLDDAISGAISLTVTSTGFDITSLGIIYGGFLAIKYNNQVTCKSGLLDVPTSTGSQVVTDPGFKPQFVLELQSTLSAYNTQSASDGGSYGVGIFTNGAVPIANSLAGRSYNEDAGNSVCKSRQSGTSGANSASLLRSPDNGFSLTCTLTSFNNTGYTKNWASVNATARKLIYLAVGETIPHGWMDEACPLPLNEGEEVVSYG